MPSQEFSVRPARDHDRRGMALLLAAVAEERDGIASEPPIDVDGRTARWGLEGTFVAVGDEAIVGQIGVEASRLG